MCLLYSKLQGNLSTFFEVGTPLLKNEMQNTQNQSVVL